jgi:hypothetical protein
MAHALQMGTNFRPEIYTPKKGSSELRGILTYSFSGYLTLYMLGNEYQRLR